MRCYICNVILSEDQVQWNSDHKDYDPCPTCLSVIEDLTAGFGDSPATVEDDLSDLAPILEGLFQHTYDPQEEG